MNDIESSTRNIEMTENGKVDLMRTIIERHNPTAKEVDELTIRRFLRARGLEVDKASELLLKTLKWRKDFIPKGYISELEISYELSQNKVFLQGFNKKGQPIVVVFGGRHVPTKGKDGLEEFKRLMVYCLDKICTSIPRGHEKFIGIVDLEGWGYRNCDIRGYLGGLTILQDCYPERVDNIFIVHVPYLFMTAWKIIYPFIDNNTRRKIVFLEKESLKSTLLQDIDENQLPDVYGGKLSLVPIQNS